MLKALKASIILALIFAASPAVAGTCETMIRGKPREYRLESATMVWYGLVKLNLKGFTPVRDRETGLMRIDIPETSPYTLRNTRPVYLMPGADLNGAIHYVKYTVDQEIAGRTRIYVFSARDRTRIRKAQDEALDLTWNTYLEQETVSPAEVAEFQRTEKDLDPDRKLLISPVNTHTNDNLAVLRVYDGSPVRIIVGIGEPSAIISFGGDTRVPIERRYPDIKLRTATNIIYEMGRLAKISEFAEAMIHEFRAYAEITESSFKSLSAAKIEPFLRGHVVIEVTGRNLRKLTQPVKDGGYGFHLDYVIENDGTARPVSAQKRKQVIESSEPNSNTKYVLHLTVRELILNFRNL
ncbi:MAG: hypothetical protein ABL958_04825 [Bdellovibrionia bacterium]